MKSRVTSAIVFLSFTLLVPVIANAQSGTIRGVVLEQGSGETLAGATVSIQGTTKGAMADVDGEYRILNVAPGIYTLEARFLGYATAVVEDVIVRTDLTTVQDFELRDEVFEGEEVVVQAVRPVVIRDLTSSESRVSSEEIAALPVQEISDIVRLQAGVNVSNSGQIHIRGGRASEVAYVVDGIRATDDYDRSQGLRIETESIQELQVISGTFNAEYGQAMSGIVNVVTKVGKNDYEANFKAWSGSYLISRPELYDGLPSSFMELDPARMYNFSGSVAGPIIEDKLTFFVTGRSFENKGWLTGRNAYSSQGAYQDLVDIDTDMNTYRTPYGERVNFNEPWYSLDTVTVQGNQFLQITDSGERDSSLVNMNEYKSYSFQGNIQFRPLSSLRFNLIGSYGNENSRGYNHQRKLVPEGLSTTQRENYSLNLKTTITPSSNTFITINNAITSNGFKNYLYENPYDPRYFNYDNLAQLQQEFDIQNPGQPYQFDQVGTDNSHFERSTTSYISKVELSYQLNDRHFIKAGLNMQADVVDFENINLQPLGNDGTELPDDFPDDQRPFVELGIPPLDTPNHSKFTRKPVYFTGYLQDKIEYESFIVNAGIRFDYFQPNARIPIDSKDPDISNPILDSNRELTREEREEIWWEDVKPKYQFSPRIGISYPVTAKGIVYFSYGYFFQMPSYEYLFTNSQILLSESSGVFGIFGNPDLKPERSTQYELGVKYEIFEGTGLEVTGFYKDTRDYVSSGVVEPTYLSNVRYGTWINRDYSISRGLTMALNQNISRQFSFNLDYTYNLVEGSNSDPAAEFNQAVASNNLTGQALTKIIQPLDWDRSHVANGTLFYSSKNWGLNTVARFMTGTPYTPSAPFRIRTGPNASVRDLRNTARYPTRFTVDVNTFYDINVSGEQISIFLNIYNLLDNRIVNSLYTDSGSPDRPLRLPTTYDETYFEDPSRFAEPRRIQLGIQFSF